MSKNQIRAVLKHYARFQEAMKKQGLSSNNIIEDDMVGYIHEAMNIGKKKGE
jgi:hypothetical protein